MSMTPLTELDAIRDAKLRQQLRRRMNACEARFRGFIEEGIRDGRVADCDPHLISLFILGGSRHMMQWYDPDGDHDLQAIVERFIQFCGGGLEPSTAPG